MMGGGGRGCRDVCGWGEEEGYLDVRLSVLKGSRRWVVEDYFSGDCL